MRYGTFNAKLFISVYLFKQVVESCKASSEFQLLLSTAALLSSCSYNDNDG